MFEKLSQFHGGSTTVGGMIVNVEPFDYRADRDHMFVVEAKLGSAGAFEMLYKRHSSALYRSIFRILRNQQDAEDAVQRSFHRAYTNLVRFREDSSFSTWITRIAINEALQLLRQRRPEALPIEETDGDFGVCGPLNLSDKQPTPEQVLAKKEMRGVLVQAISKLRPRLRSAILLREVHGLEYAEMAQHLGLSISAVKARTFHAKRQLRRYFERKYNNRALYKRSRNHGL